MTRKIWGNGILGIALAAVGLAGGCAPRAMQAAEQPAVGAERPAGELRIEVSRAERELYVIVNGEVVETHPVAVGQPEWPTPTGEWGIHVIDWNPDWTPPDSEWAEGREYKAPGEPGNPMGRARLAFNPPYTIHGTEAMESLGTAASHGSIRVANDVAIRLGKMIMEYGGAPRDEVWVERVLEDPTTMRSVSIPEPVPIRVRD
jgi:lipoprotein-anchoring transpeptidase ErfK/SrfK